MLPSSDSEQMAVYRALLTDPRRRAEDLAGDLGLPLSTVCASLARLVDLGLVERPDGPVPAGGEGDDAWSQVPLRLASPGLALRPVVEAAEQAVADQVARLQGLRHDVELLTEEYRRSRETAALSQLERLDGVEAVVTRLPELLDRVVSQVRSFVTLRPSYDALEQAQRSDGALLRRGVRVRTICLESVRADRRFMAHLAAFHAQGAEIRTTATLPARVLVLDDDVAVVAQDPSDPSIGAVVVRGKGMLAAVSALFESYWERAVDPFGTPSTPVATPLSSSERALVRLLAQGHKDETCARHLDVSVRTIRRMVAELTDRVGAGSRFELAVVAVRRGWV